MRSSSSTAAAPMPPSISPAPTVPACCSTPTGPASARKKIARWRRCRRRGCCRSMQTRSCRRNWPFRLHRSSRRLSPMSYTLDRLSNFCGQWIHHGGWYPDWIPRLFRRGAARFSDDLVHERLVFDTPAQRLSGKLLHYSYGRLRGGASQARRLFDCGCATASVRRATRRPARRAGARAHGRSCGWVLRRGFLDGRAGFMIAVFNAETVYYRFLKLGRLRTPHQ